MSSIGSVDSLRVAFVTPEFVTEPYFSGGLANYVYRVAKALVETGHQACVVTQSNECPAKLEFDGIDVRRVRLGRWYPRLNRLTRKRLPQTTRHALFAWQAYRAVAQLHRERPLHFVQSPNSSACGILTMLFVRVPHAVRISCYRPVWNELAGLERTLDLRVSERLEWLQLRFARHVFGPSNLLAEMLANEARIQLDRVIRSPFYMETPEWDSSVHDRVFRSKPYALFFGRFQLHKGFHVLAHAVPRFLERNPDAYVACVGNDAASPFGRSMKEYATSQCATNAERLLFSGSLRHSQLYPVIQGARVVVLT